MEVNPPKQEHLLALKVMRLTKPTLFTNIPVTCEEKDLPGDLFNQLMRDDPSTVNGAEVLMLGEMLTLPQNFGNIFLGETFSSYISVHNDSNQVVKDILVKADLQTSSQRLNLSASNAAVAELKPDCCIDDVIHHEVKEIGTHILVCAVSYTTQAGEKMYFRKFFKFQVLKPLDVKTKFYNAETDEVFLEAQIQNMNLTYVYGESFIGAIYYVQCNRIKFSHPSWRMCVYIWVKSIFATNGYTPVLILPKAKEGIRRKSRHH